MSTSRTRVAIAGMLLILGLVLSHQGVEATRDAGDTRPCPSADERSYLDDSSPLLNGFADSMSRFSADPYDRTLIRAELRDMERVYDDLAELDPPATLEAVHELSLLGYATMIDALNDAADGDFATATIRLEVGTDLTDRATELLNTHC